MDSASPPVMTQGRMTYHKSTVRSTGFMKTEMGSILQKIGKNTDVPVAFIFRDGQMLIGLRNYTPDKWKDISVWTAPAGRCEEGETLEEALRREVYEEVGIDDLRIIDYLGTVPGVKESDNLFVFKCESKLEPRLMEPDKFSEWRWCSISKIPSNFINPKSLELIKDIK